MIQLINTAIHISTIKIKPVDVQVYILTLVKKNDDKDPKFKIGDNVRTSKSKSIFAKEYSPKYPEEVFVIKKNQNIVSWTCYQWSQQ